MPIREGRDGKCEGRNEKCEFLARESVSSSPIVRIFGKGKASPILARQWWRHFRQSLSLSLSLCISLSLSLSLSHRKYLTHNIGSASALPIIPDHGHTMVRAFKNLPPLDWLIIGSAEALPILCVRYFRVVSVRQREREREIQRETEVTSPMSR